MNVHLVPILELDDLSRRRMASLVATKRPGGLVGLEDWDKQIPNRFGYVVCDNSLPGPVGFVVCNGGIKLGVAPAWWMAPEYEGKGYGSCAVKLLAEEAFRLGYRQIYQITYVAINTPDIFDYDKSRRMGNRFVQRFKELLKGAK